MADPKDCKICGGPTGTGKFTGWSGTPGGLCEFDRKLLEILDRQGGISEDTTDPGPYDPSSREETSKRLKAQLRAMKAARRKRG